MVESRQPDCPKQNSIGSQARVECFLGQRRSGCRDRRPANQILPKLEVMAVNVCNFTQDTHGQFGYFRSYPISRKNSYFQSHVSLRKAATCRSFDLARMEGGDRSPHSKATLSLPASNALARL